MSEDGLIKLKKVAAEETAPTQPTAGETAADRAYREHMEMLGEEGMRQMNQALTIATTDDWTDHEGFAFLAMERFVYRGGMQINNTEEIARKKAQGWTEVPDGQMPPKHMTKINETIIVLRKSRRMIDEQERDMIARLHDTGNASRALAGSVQDERQLKGESDLTLQSTRQTLTSAVESLPDREPAEQQMLTPEQLATLGG